MMTVGFIRYTSLRKLVNGEPVRMGKKLTPWQIFVEELSKTNDTLS
jgi:hypothetical protein